jgi:hypothetical protein
MTELIPLALTLLLAGGYLVGTPGCADTAIDGRAAVLPAL